MDSIILITCMIIALTIIGVTIAITIAAKEKRNVFLYFLLFMCTFLLIVLTLVLVIQIFLICIYKPLEDFTFYLCLIGIGVGVYGVTINAIFIYVGYIIRHNKMKKRRR